MLGGPFAVSIEKCQCLCRIGGSVRFDKLQQTASYGFPFHCLYVASPFQCQPRRLAVEYKIRRRLVWQYDCQPTSFT